MSQHLNELKSNGNLIIQEKDAEIEKLNQEIEELQLQLERKKSGKLSYVPDFQEQIDKTEQIIEQVIEKTQVEIQELQQQFKLELDGIETKYANDKAKLKTRISTYSPKAKEKHASSIKDLDHLSVGELVYNNRNQIEAQKVHDEVSKRVEQLEAKLAKLTIRCKQEQKQNTERRHTEKISQIDNSISIHQTDKKFTSEKASNIKTKRKTKKHDYIKQQASIKQANLSPRRNLTSISSKGNKMDALLIQLAEENKDLQMELKRLDSLAYWK